MINILITALKLAKILRKNQKMKIIMHKLFHNKIHLITEKFFKKISKYIMKKLKTLLNLII